jgi:hypothetical protein
MRDGHAVVTGGVDLEEGLLADHAVSAIWCSAVWAIHLQGVKANANVNVVIAGEREQGVPLWVELVAAWRRLADPVRSPYSSRLRRLHQSAST